MNHPQYPNSTHLLFLIPATVMSSAFVLAFTMPFVGSLIRFRANYTPRRVQLLDHDESENPTADVHSYFAMLKRVHRIEGWAGLYKGIMPAIVESLISVVLVSPLLVLFIYNPVVVREYPPVISLLFAGLTVFLLVPMEIIKNRVITTPYKLAAFEPTTALRLLLSSAERAQPLRLYLLPGVAVAAVLPAVVTVVVNVVWHLFAYHAILRHRQHWISNVLAEIVYRVCALLFLAMTTAVITPLHVIRVRLTMQRLRLEAAEGAAVEETAPATVPPVYSSEDVVELRTDQPAYTGVKDCGKSILREEGKAAFFRGWWLTAIGLAPIFFVTNGQLNWFFFTR